MDRYVALIPARGGSKGIPRKNLQEIAGLPMVAHSILVARQIKQIARVFVSSEDSDILQAAKVYGAIPFVRPKRLSGDHTSTEAVMLHFLRKVKCIRVILIQPTSPMVLPKDLEAGIKKYEDGRYDSLFSAARMTDMLLWDEDSMYPINYDPRRRGRRQTNKRDVLHENGAFFITSKRAFSRSGCRMSGKIGYSEMPVWRSFQVDDQADLDHIRLLMTLKAT